MKQDEVTIHEVIARAPMSAVFAVIPLGMRTTPRGQEPVPAIVDVLQETNFFGGRNLDLRCLVSHTPKEGELLFTTESHVLGKLSRAGWKIRTTGILSSPECLILDRQLSYLWPPTSLRTAWIRRVFAPEADTLLRWFDAEWDNPGESSVEDLYSDTILIDRPSSLANLLVVSTRNWNRILEQLIRNPEKLYALDPREFEEVVAELLERQGVRTKLTGGTRDGGRDILGFVQTELGEHLYLVECKRYERERPVGVSLIRNLFGVVQAERATAGILVTTSRFTSDAIAFQRPLKHQLTLRDYDDLISWIKASVR